MWGRLRREERIERPERPERPERIPKQDPKRIPKQDPTPIPKQYPKRIPRKRPFQDRDPEARKKVIRKHRDFTNMLRFINIISSKMNYYEKFIKRTKNIKSLRIQRYPFRPRTTFSFPPVWSWDRSITGWDSWLSRTPFARSCISASTSCFHRWLSLVISLSPPKRDETPCRICFWLVDYAHFNLLYICQHLLK